MDRGTYQSYAFRYGGTSGRAGRLRVADRVFVVLVALMYISGGIYLAVMRDAALLGYIIVPGISFIVMSIVRRIINRPRPAEVYDFTPVLGRHGQGCSLPSRHVFSAFVIACALYWVWLPLSIACLVCGVALGFIRVVGGLHWPSDAIVGAFLGLVFGIGGYLIMYL